MSALSGGAERAIFEVDGSCEDDSAARSLRRRKGGGPAIDRGDERLVNRRDRVGFAHGQRRDIAATEGEAEQERRQEARRETTPVGLEEKREKPRRSQRLSLIHI